MPYIPPFSLQPLPSPWVDIADASWRISSTVPVSVYKTIASFLIYLTDIIGCSQSYLICFIRFCKSSKLFAPPVDLISLGSI